MGWFLTSGKSSGKGKGKARAKASGAKRSGAGRAGAGGAWEPAVAWRIALVALWLGGIAALLVGGYHGRLWLIDHVGEVRADRGETPVRVRLASAPAWFGDARAERLCSAAAAKLSPNPMDHDALADARAVFADSGWVRAVHQLVRRPGGEVVARVDFHTPVALVESAAGYHLVAIERHGTAARVIRLPGTYAYHEVSNMDLMPVTGAAYPPPPAPGEVWRGEDVAAGVALAVRLMREPFAEQVRQVDVANYNGRRDRGRAHLMLKTARGAIFWGRAPGNEDPLEPSAAAKIAALRDLNQRFGSIDNGGQRVDVQRADRVVFEGAAGGRGG